MPRGENIQEINKIAPFKPLEDMKGRKLSSRAFSVRLPQEAAEKLLALDTKDRTIFMRKAILEALEAQSN